MKLLSLYSITWVADTPLAGERFWGLCSGMYDNPGDILTYHQPLQLQLEVPLRLIALFSS